MPDDPEIERIARRESVDRVRRIQTTLAASHWREVYRNAHTLAGIAPDPDMAQRARELASMLCDERGRVRAPADAEAVERVGRLLAEGAARLEPGPDQA